MEAKKVFSKPIDSSNRADAVIAGAKRKLDLHLVSAAHYKVYDSRVQ